MNDSIALMKEMIRSGSITRDATQQEALLRICDKAKRCILNDMPDQAGFFSEETCMLAESMLRSINDLRYIITGAYPNAERKIFLFLPSREHEEPPIPITVLRFHSADRHSFSHREVLGTLMSLGIRRECIGDILPSEGSTDVLVLKEIAPYIRMNTERIGRNRCRCEEIAPEQIRMPERKTKTICATVASPRLDSILAALFEISRSNAAELIKSGKATLNGHEALQCGEEIDPEAIITCRGYGKGRFVRSDGLSKKGRYRIVLERYL